MSKGKRREFSREFKLSAVKRALAGESVAALSRELGVPSGHMYKWRQHYRSVVGHFDCGGTFVRLLVLVPVGVVVYFLAYPSQFTAFVGWLSRLTH